MWEASSAITLVCTKTALRGRWATSAVRTLSDLIREGDNERIALARCHLPSEHGALEDAYVA